MSQPNRPRVAPLVLTVRRGGRSLARQRAPAMVVPAAAVAAEAVEVTDTEKVATVITMVRREDGRSKKSLMIRRPVRGIPLSRQRRTLPTRNSRRWVTCPAWHTLNMFKRMSSRFMTSTFRSVL